MVDILTWCWGFQTKINHRRFVKVYLICSEMSELESGWVDLLVPCWLGIDTMFVDNFGNLKHTQLNFSIILVL